jgi:hypothetical protein
LYGGDGVLVKQSAVTAPPIEITCDEKEIGVRSQDSYEIYHEQEVAEVSATRSIIVSILWLTLLLVTGGGCVPTDDNAHGHVGSDSSPRTRHHSKVHVEE